MENPRKLLYGHLDGFPLSALGRRQATEVGRSLRDAGLRRIVHSPLERAVETATLINAELPVPVPMEADGNLREAEFSRYLQGVPYWQIPLRRPLWFVHKARRGLVPGDEAVRDLGGRVLGVARRLAAEHQGEPVACVSHADPLQAVWVLLEERAHNEREMYRKQVDRAGMLRLEVTDAGLISSWDYRNPPTVSPV